MQEIMINRSWGGLAAETTITASVPEALSGNGGCFFRELLFNGINVNGIL